MIPDESKTRVFCECLNLDFYLGIIEDFSFPRVWLVSYPRWKQLLPFPSLVTRVEGNEEAVDF